MKHIPFGKPMIGIEEKNAVIDVLNNPVLVHGPRAKEFETVFAKFTGASHAVSVSSCTAALHLTYFYLGCKNGDEVIVPAQTHTATAHAVELTGAKPVFVDSEKETGNIDTDQIEDKITEKTRAISIVHYLGMPVNMERIVDIAKKYDLFVVEDCALAMGSYFKGVHVGLWGDVGCFSFYPVKHMTTAEGGMLITRREDVAQKISKFKAFGVDRHMGERTIPGIYDVTMLGYNYRLNEIQAALGMEQLKRMEYFLKKRKENFYVLREGLKEVDEISHFQSSHHEYQSSYYCFSILLNEALSNRRFEMVKFLNDHGIGTSIYYPKPVPHFSYYKSKYGYDEKSFPIASWISRNSIALPVGPHVSIEDIKYIVTCLKEAVVKVK